MSSDPEAGRKLRDAVERYAAKQVGAASVNRLDAVLTCFVLDDRAVEQLQTLIIDVVFRFLFAAASAKYNEADGPGTEFDRLLDELLVRHTRLTEQNLDNFRKVLKQAVLTSKSERPKSEVRDRLLQKQRDNLCYLCGKEVSEEDEKLDHVWPRSAGGGTGQTNLWKAHNACEAAKQDLAVPGDAPLGRFAFGDNLPRYLESPPGPWRERAIGTDQEFVTLVDDLRAALCRVALVVRQKGKCFKCEQDFRRAEATNVQRLETDLPWWFPNTIVVCGKCAGEV